MGIAGRGQRCSVPRMPVNGSASFVSGRGEAQDIRRLLQQEDFAAGDLDEIIRQMQALDDMRVYQDSEEIARLQTYLIEELKRFEYRLRREVDVESDELYLAASRRGAAGVPRPDRGVLSRALERELIPKALELTERCADSSLSLACWPSLVARRHRPSGGWGWLRMPPKFPPEQATHRDFTFSRGLYESDRREPGGQGWHTDYPDADRNLMIRLSDLTTTTVGFDSRENPDHVVVRLSDPDILNYPFLFHVRCGYAMARSCGVHASP